MLWFLCLSFVCFLLSQLPSHKGLHCHSFIDFNELCMCRLYHLKEIHLQQFFMAMHLKYSLNLCIITTCVIVLNASKITVLIFMCS